MFDKVRSRFADWIAPETRAVTLGISPRIDPTNVLGSIGGRITPAGVKIDAGKALGIAAFWSCVDLISSLIAASRLEIGREEQSDDFEPLRSDSRYDLLRRRPNKTTPKFHFWQAIIAHSLTHKGGFAEIEWSARGLQPLAFHLMDPRQTEPIVKDDRSVEYKINARGDTLAAVDVLHIRGLTWDGVRGYSLVDQAAEILGVARAQLLYEGSVYGNGAQIGGHIEMPGSVNDQQKAEFRAGWEQTHQGPGNANRLPILTGGAKWVSTSYSPVDAQMTVAQTAKALEIARLFRVPPHMIGLMEGATVGNAEEQALQFLKMSLSPRMEAIEGELDLKLLSPQERNRGLCSRHNTRNLERGNMAARIAFYQGLSNLGAITPNEVRRGEGFIPFKWKQADDAYIGTNNLTPLRLVGDQPTQPATNQPQTEPDADDESADPAPEV